MNNKYILKVLSSLAFIVSAIFTVRLLTSTSVGIVNTVLITLMGIIFEFSKCFFLYKSIDQPHNVNNMVRGISAVVATFLFCVSILASLSFLQNETNKNKNKAILKSDGYKQQIQAKEQLKDLYNTKKQQIVILEEQTKQQIKALADERDAMPSNYLTRKSNVNKKISDLQEQSNKQILEINSSLDTIVSKQSEVINVKDIAFNAEKGYTAFLEVMAKSISNEDTTYTVEELEVILFSLLSVCFEFVAVLLYYYNKRESVLNYNEELIEMPKKTITNNRNIGFEPAVAKKDDAIKGQQNEYIKSVNKYELGKHSFNLSPSKESIVEKKIGFISPEKITKQAELIEPQSVQSNVIIDDEIQMYLDFMYNREHQTMENVSPGYMKISKNIKLTADKCRKIKDHLEKMGIVQVISGQTNIVLPKKQAEKVLSLKLNV